MMRTKTLAVCLVVVMMLVFSGCQSAEPTETPGGVAAGGAPNGAVDGNILAMGILRLEGSSDAVIPEQAAKLLPLWQMLAGGSLVGDAETASVIKQIQATLTESQMAAITASDWTTEDRQAWTDGQGNQAPGDGGFGPAGDATDEERAAMREKFQNMTQAEREQALADMGVQPRTNGGGGFEGNGSAPRGAGGFRGGGSGIMQALIDLLTERAAE